MSSMRVGLGYDIHRFADNRNLMLGGVKIEYPRGLEGHSDADVLLHAICDAILGALGEGDIGEHFPNTDSAYKDIASLELLRCVKQVADQAGYEVVNIDATVIAEEPNIKKYKNQMRILISQSLDITANDVNIKATTQEKLGTLGRKEGIAAMASVLMTRKQ